MTLRKTLQPMRTMPWAAVAWGLAMLAGCVSSEAPSRVDMPNEEDRVVAVWVIDVDATLARAASAVREAGEAAADAVALNQLRRDLMRVDTELGLNGDGTFILRNRAADAGGVLTVEGTWTRAGPVITLSGIRVSGRTVVPAQINAYRLENERLVPAGSGSPAMDADRTRPVLKKGLVPR